MHYICSQCRKNFVSKATQPKCTHCGHVHSVPTNLTTSSQLFARDGCELKDALTQQEAKQFGRYQIVGELGRGGMGVVHKAYDTQLKRIVALKILLSGSMANQKEIDRFYREAQATAKLKHSNIVRLYDVGSEQGMPYFAMDFIEGQSLKEYAKEKSLSVKQIVALMTKVCHAIEYAHNQGIIHRDIKPANIMIDKDGEPHVMDFGLAKIIDASQQLSKSGMIIGTLQYMSPEQADGRIRDIDQRSDLYSLGATLYELLTGKAPFKANTTAKVLNMVLNKSPVAPTKIKKTIPKKLEKICLKALQKKREHRYANVGELINALTNKEKTSARLPILTIIILIATVCTFYLYVFNRLNKIPKGWSQKSWEACWDEDKGYIDFTNKTWKSLSHSEQVEYAKNYQQWYAQYKGLSLKKKFTIKNTDFGMVLIPPGKFLMGLPFKSHKKDQKRHWVVISKPFYLSTTEVTQGQWYAVVGKKPWDGKSYAKDNAQHAVNYVSWNDINQKFLPKLGGRYSLPTEAQWEYACRSGTLTRFYWGNDNYRKVGDYMWYDKNTSNVGRKYPHPVGQKLPNGWGLYDMSGNVYEWCKDRYHKTKVYVDGKVDPVCTSGPQCVIRGGNWHNGTVNYRSAHRAYSPLTGANFSIGFRFSSP